MPDLTVVNSATCDGKTYTTRRTIPASAIERVERTLPVAKNGTLSTRGSTTAGTLTMAASHGIMTAARLDLYWASGSRRGILVGTVSGNSVPFTLGDGDDLPAQTTVITAQVPTEVECLLTGNNVQYLTSSLSQKGTAVLAESDDGEVYAHVEATPTTSGGGKQWYKNNDATNPLAGADVAKVFLSNGSSTATCLAIVNIGHGVVS